MGIIYSISCPFIKLEYYGVYLALIMHHIMVIIFTILFNGIYFGRIMYHIMSHIIPQDLKNHFLYFFHQILRHNHSHLMTNCDAIDV